MHRELPAASILAAILVLLPLPWHWRAGNVATLSIIVWLFAVNVIYAVDSLIWSHNVARVALVWCDITTKILIGANLALPAACMCICIHLEQVASVRQALTTRSQKRRRQIMEAVLCYVVPVIWMGLHYIVQGHRFDIIEEFGCRPSIYVSIPAIFLMWVPSLIMSFVTLVFAAMAFSHFVRRRITFAKHLENSNSGLNASRYLRLMLLAIIEMFASAAAVSATLGFSVIWDMRPWTNWADVHFDFWRVDTFATAFLPPFIYRFYYACWWIAPVSAYLFCAFFAFGQEAMKEYKAHAMWVWTRVLKQKPRTRSVKASTGGFVPMPPSRSTLRFGQSVSVSSLPPAHLSMLSGEYTPSTPGSPKTPASLLEKKLPFSEHSKEDTVLIGTPIVMHGHDDDLPSYYASSAPGSRPHSSVQIVPTDVDPSVELHDEYDDRLSHLGPHAV
ncbi:pheromone A receptor-domain-containing protein [Trametes meyenii]|nr:pheromone A receptor-domain-containing protein [Trametes meyenii]